MLIHAPHSSFLTCHTLAFSLATPELSNVPCPSSNAATLPWLQAGSLRTRFKPYSKFPPCYKDISFWLSPQFTENNLCEVVGVASVMHSVVMMSVCGSEGRGHSE